MNLALFFEQAHIVLKDEQAITPLSGQLTKNAEFDEVIDERSGGIGLCLDEIGDHFDVDHRRPVKRLHKHLRVSLATHMESGHIFALYPLLECKDVPEHLDGQGSRSARPRRRAAGR